MILGTGIDIIEVGRIKRAVSKPHFVNRVFTAQEISYCESRGAQSAASYAARFAGKEAVLKAFGTGLREGALLDIEILPDELGCPTVSLMRFFAEQQKLRRISKIHISLSHTKEYAVAQVVFWGDTDENCIS